MAGLPSMPIASWAPMLAEMNARPATNDGMERPERKKSVLVRVESPKQPADREDDGEVHEHEDVVDRR